jgi:hypothetical protein
MNTVKGEAGSGEAPRHEESEETKFHPFQTSSLE